MVLRDVPFRWCAPGVIVLAAAGCAGGPAARAGGPGNLTLAQRVETLKAYHLQFIDDFTVDGPDAPPKADPDAVRRRCEEGARKYQEVLDQASGDPGDPVRSALSGLAASFQSDCELVRHAALMGTNWFVKPSVAAVRAERERYYDIALAAMRAPGDALAPNPKTP